MWPFSPKWKGNTFKPIDLEVATLMPLDYGKFVEELRARVVTVKNDRVDWYDQQYANYSSVNEKRSWMIALGAAAGFFTVVASGLRFVSILPGWLHDTHWDIACLAVALLLYAVMSLLAFVEKGGEDVSGYFRSIMAIISIRDLWTDYQFKDSQLQLELGTPTDAAAVVAAKKRWLDTALSFAKSLDAITTQELTDWRGVFQSAMAQLSSTAAAGLTAAQTALSDAAKAAAAAAKPASVNITVTYAAAGTAVVTIDNEVVGLGPQRTFSKQNVPQGERKVRVEIQDAGGAVQKSAEKIVPIAAGINEVALTPS